MSILVFVFSFLIFFSIENNRKKTTPKNKSFGSLISRKRCRRRRCTIRIVYLCNWVRWKLEENNVQQVSFFFSVKQRELFLNFIFWHQTFTLQVFPTKKHYQVCRRNAMLAVSLRTAAPLTENAKLAVSLPNSRFFNGKLPCRTAPPTSHREVLQHDVTQYFFIDKIWISKYTNLIILRRDTKRNNLTIPRYAFRNNANKSNEFLDLFMYKNIKNKRLTIVLKIQ